MKKQHETEYKPQKFNIIGVEKKKMITVNNIQPKYAVSDSFIKELKNEFQQWVDR